MKAVRINQFGGPEVMNIEHIDRPIPASDELLIRVYASGVNPADWVIREGGNDFLRPILKLPLTLGWDAAGIVEQTGSEVTDFKKGDQVYGVPNFPGDGSYAEYCVGKASQFAIKPTTIGFNKAAAVPLAALTAWSGIFGDGKLQAGHRILIQGASGGVGSFAVQFAKAVGAYVIGVASTPNVPFVKELGADEVIDYKTQRFEELVKDMDIVFDASPNRENSERIRSASVLKDGGTVVSVNIDLPFSEEVKHLLTQRSIRFETTQVQVRRDWLQEIASLIDMGNVKVIVSKVYPLEEVAAAHRESETWHVRGKLVLEIKQENVEA